MEELAKLDLKKVAVKMAQKVGPMVGELDPKRLAEGNLVLWRDSQQCAWQSDDVARVISMPTEARPTQVKLAGKKTGHSWWADIEDIKVLPDKRRRRSGQA